MTLGNKRKITALFTKEDFVSHIIVGNYFPTVILKSLTLRIKMVEFIHVKQYGFLFKNKLLIITYWELIMEASEVTKD